MKVKELIDEITDFEQLLECYLKNIKRYFKSINSIEYNFSTIVKAMSEKDFIELSKQYKVILQKFSNLEPCLKKFDKELEFLEFLKRFLSKSHPENYTNDLEINSITVSLNCIIGKLKKLPLEDNFFSTTHYEYPDVSDLIKSYLDVLHPIIQTSSVRLFLDNYYSESIEAASKAINQYIRDKTGLEKDGSKLINETFSTDKPILAFSDLSTDTLQNEQRGFMEMLRGFMIGVRNPLAHSPAKSEDPQKVFEYLVMASLFCKRIDDAEEYGLNKVQSL